MNYSSQGRARGRDRGGRSSPRTSTEAPTVPIPHLHGVYVSDTSMIPPVEGYTPPMYEYPPSLHVYPPPMLTPAETSSSVVPTGSDTRLLLYIYEGTLMPSNRLSSMISRIMYSNMEPRAHTFSEISPGTIQQYWKTFQTEVRWDPVVIDTQLVYKFFLQRAANRYTSMLNHYKKHWFLGQTRPSWDDDVWNSLVQHWNDPNTKKKSESCRKNYRLSEPESPTISYACHKGRSRGATEVARLNKLRTERPAELWKIVEYYHRYGNEDFTYNHIADIIVQDEASQLTQQASEDDSNQTPVPNMSELYLKNRCISSDSDSTSYGMPIRRYTQEEVLQRIAHAHQEMEDKFRQVILDRETALRDEFSNQMRQLEDMIMSRRGGLGSGTVKGRRGVLGSGTVKGRHEDDMNNDKGGDDR